MVSVSLSLGASAQRGGFSHGGYSHGGGGYYFAPRVYASPYRYGYGFGLGLGYPLFGYPYYGYPYYGYGGYRGGSPYSLSAQLEDIKYYYKDKITATRRNKTIKHRERRQEIRNIKSERDRAIDQARMNYHRPRTSNPTPGTNYNNNYQSNTNTY